MFEVAIAMFISAVPAIGAVSTAYTLGKDITSAYSLLAQKRHEKLTPMEMRFIDISPLAALVQRKVATRLLHLFIFSFLVGGIILAASILYREQLQEYKFALSFLVIASFLSVNISSSLKIIKERFITVGEFQILKEYKSCYEGYILEKIKKLKVLTKAERLILDTLRKSKISNASFSDVSEIISKLGDSYQEIKVDAVLKKLAKFGYINIRKNYNCRWKISICSSTEEM